MCCIKFLSFQFWQPIGHSLDQIAVSAPKVIDVVLAHLLQHVHVGIRRELSHLLPVRGLVLGVFQRLLSIHELLVHLLPRLQPARLGLHPHDRLLVAQQTLRLRRVRLEQQADLLDLRLEVLLDGDEVVLLAVLAPDLLLQPLDRHVLLLELRPNRDDRRLVGATAGARVDEFGEGRGRLRVVCGDIGWEGKEERGSV